MYQKRQISFGMDVDMLILKIGTDLRLPGTRVRLEQQLETVHLRSNFYTEYLSNPSTDIVAAKALFQNSSLYVDSASAVPMDSYVTGSFIA